MKKTLLVLVMVLLAASMLFVSCKKNEAAPAAAAADAGVEKMEISVFTIQQRNQPPADNKIYKWIEEKFGVTFKWDILVGDKDQKIGVMIASGDLPDVVEVDSEKFQGAGLLIDIKPLVEKYCPNIMSHYANVWKQMIYIDSEKDAEGNITTEHLYSLPNYGVLSGADAGTYYNQNAFWIQKCVLKEFGYPVIKTVDEFFDLVEAYAKKYPTIDGMPTIPFHIMTYDWEAFNLWNTPNFLAGYPNDGNGHVTWDAAKGKYIYEDNFIDANAYKWFKLANGYYKRGLIDPESWTDNSDQWKAKLTQGRILGHFSQGWEWMGDIESHHQTAGMWERTYAPLPVVFDESITPHYKDETLPNLQRGYGFSVKSGEAKAIKILKFLDTMLEPENSKVLEWGIEGEDYYIDTDGSKTGAAGRPYRTQEQRDNQANQAWQEKNKATLLREEAPKWEGSYPDGYFTSMDALPWEFELTQKAEDVELFKAYGVSSYVDFVTPVVIHNSGWYPMWQCNPAAENGGFEGEAALAMTGFETLQRKMLPMAIMAKTDAEFEAIWADFCEQMKPLTAVYNEFMQGELDARVKNFGGEVK